MTVVNQKRNMKDRDNSKQEADHHAKHLPRTAWLMTILQTKNTTVGIVATCSHRGPDLEPSITAEITYYTHGSLITQNCQWKYLLRPTTSKIAITHHHQLLLQETAWPLPGDLGAKDGTRHLFWFDFDPVMRPLWLYKFGTPPTVPDFPPVRVVCHIGGWRVPALPETARETVTLMYKCSQTVNTVVVKAKTIFECLYLVPGQGTFGPRFNCLCVSTPPTAHSVANSRFFCLLAKFFIRGPSFFWSARFAK